MKRFVIAFLLIFLGIVFRPVPVRADEFTERAAKIAEYKKWLDTLGPQGSHYWMRLDACIDHIDYTLVRASIVPTSKPRSSL